MIVLEETHNIAITIGKGENLRVTASRMFAAVVEYVKTPDNDGAQQVIDAGYDPTDKGIWKMITADPSWPKAVGTSWGTARKLLTFKGDAEADRRDRERQSEVNDRYNSAIRNSTNVTTNGELDAWDEPPHEVDKVAALMTRVKDLTTEELRTFINKLSAYARALGLVK